MSTTAERQCRAPYSTEPFAFLAWLARQVSSPGAPCAAAMFQAGGVLVLIGPGPGGTARLLWAPPHAAIGRAADGLVGRVAWDGMDDAVALRMAARLSSVVHAWRPVMLEWGPGPDASAPVLLTPESLGGILRRQLSPSATRWGPYTFAGFEQAGDSGLDAAFRGSATGAGGDVVFRISLPDGGADRDPERGFGRTDVTLTRIRDDRAPDLLRRLEHQIERLVGFSLGRALGRDPVLRARPPAPAAGEPRQPEPPTEPPPEPPPAGPIHAEPGPPPEPPPAPGAPVPAGLAQALQTAAMPFELGPESFLRPWGNNFVANELLVLSRGLWRVVNHGSRECTCGTVPILGQPDRYHGGPWLKELLSPGDALVTDFDDAAALGGGEERLDEAIAAALAGGGGRPVFVNPMCDYECIGDDADGVVRRWRERTGARLLMHEGVEAAGPLAAGDNRWAPVLGMLREPAAPAPDPDPLGVHVAGFPLGDGATRAGLIDLVAASGVTFCGASFPFMDRASQTAFRRASAWVVTPWVVADKGLLPALSRLGVAVRRVAAPFGVEGTLAWLDGLRDAVGLPPLEAGASAALAGTWPERLAAVRAETAAHRVGLVAPADQGAEALSPRIFSGLDPVALLRELGFRPVVVLARPRTGAPPSPPADAPDVVVQADGEPIVDTLRRAACDLVYSDHAGDSRVTRAGATPFDVRLLVPGIPGAVETARRLLALCRVPFHARYARMLGGDAP